MDQSDTISLILHGCRLAKNLELNLSNMANQPEMLSSSCEEIRKVFADARHRLDLGLLVESRPAAEMDASLQDRLKSRCTEAMNRIQAQALAPQSAFHMVGMLQADKAAISTLELQKLGSSQIACNTDNMAGKEVLSSNISDSCKGSSSSQRKQRRKEYVDKKVERVPAPMMGNTEIPPEDGHTWRKYGQKEILGSRFPRAYYRCTHQKLYQCPAKKQVQRINDDPYMFEVAYLGNHTCHMSSTAPSVPVKGMTQEMSQSMAMQPLTTSLSSWLPTEFPTGVGRASSSIAGPSTAPSGKEFEYPVADMADVMFNSGSSSSNSMDFIFHALEDKRDQGK